MMKTLLFCAFLCCVFTLTAVSAEPATTPSKPLDVGATAPSGTLLAPDGSSVAADDIWKVGSTLVIVYRGSWCPYCNTHLAEIAKIHDQLQAANVKVIAISPDMPDINRAIADDGITRYSDQDLALLNGFGLAYMVDAETMKKLQSYNIDIEAASGRTHHQLPVPAAFLIDNQGVIRFAHADADYKKRISADEVLAAVASLSTP